MECKMDKEVKHICDEIEIANKSQQKLKERGIVTKEHLLEAKQRIQRGELDNIKEEVREKLVLVAEWIANNSNANILEDFDEDEFDKFKEQRQKNCIKNEDHDTEDADKADQPSSGQIDRHMKHICEQVSVLHTRRQLEHYKLFSLVDLAMVKARAEKGELTRLSKEVINNLIIAADWIAKNPTSDIIDEFDKEVFDKLYQDYHCGRFARDYINHALGKPYCEKDTYRFQDCTEEDLLEVLRQVKEKVMESENLREKCGKFDYNSFLEKVIRHFHELVGRDPTAWTVLRRTSEKLLIVAGRTQAGKTSVKGVMQSLCGMLKIKMVVLTKGVGESILLHDKLVDQSEGTPMKKEHIIVASNKRDKLYYKEKNSLISTAFDRSAHGGTLVIADTPTQVGKAIRAIESYLEHNPGGHFVVIVDEADAMYRTRDKRQKFEQALQQLLALNPSLTVMVSATPVPLMVELVYGMKRDPEDIEFFNLEPQDNYVGIEHIKPLEIDGKKVFLEQNELSGQKEYTIDGITICCCNDKNVALYDDALKDITTRKGILVLGCSCSRVYAKNNIFDKADSVQELYASRGIQIVVITFSGRGISVKEPGQEWDHETWRNGLIGKDVLESIDNKHGLEMPVFIFGYTKMCRGVSFRSSRRVPTHMLMALGRGHNTSTIVQTLGRATFNGRNILHDNGFDHVTALTTSNDFTLCAKMQNYISEIQKRIQEKGDTLADAMSGANEKIPDSANFLRHTFRELGRVKGLKKQMEECVNVEDAPVELSTDEEDAKEKFWCDEEAQMLLRSLDRLGRRHLLVDTEDVEDDLGEEEGRSIRKCDLTQLLRKFCDVSLITKAVDNMRNSCHVNRLLNPVASRLAQYEVLRVDRLVRFINPDLALDLTTSDDEDEDSPNSDSEQSTNSGNCCKPHALAAKVSNVSTSAAGSNSSDECGSDVPSISMASEHVEQMTRCPKSKVVVSPEKNAHVMSTAPASFVGRRVAKQCTTGGKIYFGSVLSSKELYGLLFWSIKYDDGVEEDMSKVELQILLHLYDKERANDHTKPSNVAAAPSTLNESLTNIDGIQNDVMKAETCIIQSDKKRSATKRAAEIIDDAPLNCTTSTKIAKIYGGEMKIIRDENGREIYDLTV